MNDEQREKIHVDRVRLAESMRSAFPGVVPGIIDWAESNVIFTKSVLSKHFNISVTPWIREPLERAADDVTRIIDLMKPIQSGGSAAGEVVLLYYINFWRGFLQYNWSNDKRALERWNSRISDIFNTNLEEKLKAAILSNKGEIDFGNVFFRMQGVFVPDNLDSDSIAMQVNEELHSWEPGHLKKAEGRSTQVWNFKRFNVSNAGDKGDQFDQSHRDGTMQDWEVICPHCKKKHVMQERYDKRRPDLGGLRYDAEGCRMGFMEYNYNKLRPTIEYQMPCGGRVHNEDMVTRKQMSITGGYTEPTNIGAEVTHRSYRYDCVIVDSIDWMVLIKEKHTALKMRKLGDPEPYKRFVRERACRPYDENDAEGTEVVTVTSGLRKSNEGLPHPRLRLFSLDKQQGVQAKNELPHWWLVIRDFKVEDGVGLRSLLVYEGMRETDGQVIETLREYKCNMWQGVADSGDDTTNVYLFCMQHGINAIKGGKEQFGYSHVNGTRRIFSPERPLHKMIGRESKFPYRNIGGDLVPDPREPMFWLYVKPGIRERLHWLRENTKYETPENVSEDYANHQEAEQREEHRNPSDNSIEYRWIQKKDRNDLFVCEAYIAMQVDQANLIVSLEIMKQKQKEAQQLEKESKENDKRTV
jgi:hypothetical protein